MQNQTAWRRLVIALTSTCVSAATAVSAAELATSTVSLERQSQSEYEEAGRALREKYAREAAGDFIGAQVAANAAAAHRFRFLDLKQDLERRRAPPSGPPSVAASQNPFLLGWPSSTPPATATVPAVKAARREVTGTAPAAWDMYRPRTLAVDESEVARLQDPSVDAGSHGRGLYLSEVSTPVAPTSATAPVTREPYLVYRERSERVAAVK